LFAEELCGQEACLPRRPRKVGKGVSTLGAQPCVHLSLMHGERGAEFLSVCARKCEAYWEEHPETWVGTRGVSRGSAQKISGRGVSGGRGGSCGAEPEDARANAAWNVHRRIITAAASVHSLVHIWPSSCLFPIPRAASSWPWPVFADAGREAFCVNVRCGVWEPHVSLSVANWVLAVSRERDGGSCLAAGPDQKTRVADLIYGALPCLHAMAVETSVALRMIASALQVVHLSDFAALFRDASNLRDYQELAAICLQAGVKLEWSDGLAQSGVSCLSEVLRAVHRFFDVDLGGPRVSSAFVADLAYVNSLVRAGLDARE
jgi:hypothetical protein